MSSNKDPYKEHKKKYVEFRDVFVGRSHFIELIEDEDKVLYVKKKIPYSNEGGPNFFFDREIELLKETQNTNLPFVPLIEYSEPTIDEEGYIITKYMEGGTVYYQLTNKPSSGNDGEAYISPISVHESHKIPHIDLDDTKKMIIIYGSAFAISFLHKRNIIHRDIKPENILLDLDCRPYLFDFGSARRAIGPTQMSGVRGTPHFMAPEMYETSNASLNADIYSFGVTMNMIFSGKLNMIVDNQKSRDVTELPGPAIMHYFQKGYQYQIPDIDPTLAQLIKDCCSHNPSARPTIDVVLQTLESQSSKFGPEFQEYIDQMKKK